MYVDKLDGLVDAAFYDRMSKAGKAQIDGKHVCTDESLRGLDRVLTGATPGHQNVDLRFAQVLKDGRG